MLLFRCPFSVQLYHSLKHSTAHHAFFVNSYALFALKNTSHNLSGHSMARMNVIIKNKQDFVTLEKAATLPEKGRFGGGATKKNLNRWRWWEHKQQRVICVPKCNQIIEALRKRDLVELSGSVEGQPPIINVPNHSSYVRQVSDVTQNCNYGAEGIMACSRPHRSLIHT